jgi:hypothetical protein
MIFLLTAFRLHLYSTNKSISRQETYKKYRLTSQSQQEHFLFWTGMFLRTKGNGKEMALHFFRPLLGIKRVLAREGIFQTTIFSAKVSRNEGEDGCC